MSALLVCSKSHTRPGCQRNTTITPCRRIGPRSLRQRHSGATCPRAALRHSSNGSRQSWESCSTSAEGGLERHALRALPDAELGQLVAQLILRLEDLRCVWRTHFRLVRSVGEAGESAGRAVAYLFFGSTASRSPPAGSGRFTTAEKAESRRPHQNCNAVPLLIPQWRRNQRRRRKLFAGSVATRFRSLSLVASPSRRSGGCAEQPLVPLLLKRPRGPSPCPLRMWHVVAPFSPTAHLLAPSARP
jgi:hypothetical protein